MIRHHAGVFATFLRIFPLSPSFLSLLRVAFLSACLLYSRLVLNLQKFIRYKLLLPSYSFIAPRRIESSFSLLFFFPLCCFTTVGGFFQRRASAPAPPHQHPLSPPYELETPGAHSTSAPLCCLFPSPKIGRRQKNNWREEEEAEDKDEKLLQVYWAGGKSQIRVIFFL